jgi:hypothetical protein
METIEMHKTKVSHYDREITTMSRQGKPLRGRMSVHDRALRVTTPLLCGQLRPLLCPPKKEFAVLFIIRPGRVRFAFAGML